MPLVDHVQARVSRQHLVQLTNQNEQSRTAINTGVLDAAAADAEATFLVETGLDYDDTDPLHIAVAVQGVMHFLMSYTQMAGRNVDAARQTWQNGLIRVAQTRGSERRILPQTNSTLEPSVERPGRRPDYDRRRWDGFVPNAPAGTDGDQDDYLE